MMVFMSNFSMGNQTVKDSDQQKLKRVWTLYMEKDGIQVYSMYEDCNDKVNGIHQENVVLKFVNTTGKNLSVDWDLILWYSDKSINNDNSDKEYHFSIHLNAGETKAGSCKNRNKSKEMVIFSKFLNMENKSVLNEFELRNFDVKPIN